MQRYYRRIQVLGNEVYPHWLVVVALPWAHKTCQVPS